jgi:hypothetical protein
MVEILYPYIVLFYFFDCFNYIYPTHFVFLSNWGDVFTKRKYGITIFGILPNCKALIVRWAPICLTEHSIYIPTLINNNFNINEGKHFYFNQFQSVGVNSREVIIDGMPVFKAASPVEAEFIMGVIIDLKEADLLHRKQVIESKIRESFNLRKLKRVNALYSKSFVLIESVSFLLFVYTFLILPLALYVDIFRYFPINFILCFIGLLYSFQLGVIYLWGKRFYRNKKYSLNTDLLSMVMFPPTSIHLLSKVTRDIFIHYDYLTVASLFLRKDHLIELFRHELAYIDQGINQKKGDLSYFWAVRKKHVFRLIEFVDLNIGDLEWKRCGEDTSAASYCPICLSEFRLGFNSCADCGVQLRPFVK